MKALDTNWLSACCLQVLSYFREYHPAYVEWLDDSSCNILFRGEAAQLLKNFSLSAACNTDDDTTLKRLMVHAAMFLVADEFTAKRSIFGLGKPLPPEDIPEGQGAL